MITIITSNENKIREFKQIIGDKFEFEVEKVEYPELRSDDPCEIVMMCTKSLAEKLKKPIVVEDSGLFINALNDFPGTCTKYNFVRIGNEGILKLMEDKNDRTCSYKSAVGYCEPGKEPMCFLGVENGTIALKEAGSGGWGQDTIFIPQGKTQTYAEIKKPEDVNLFRRKAVEKLIQFIIQEQD